MVEIIRGLHNVRKCHRNSVCTIGNFDGVHLGHRALLATVYQEAQTRKTCSLVMTFEPQSREYFQSRLVPARLTRFREKVELISELGIKFLLCLPFNERLQKTTADSMIQDYLRSALGVQHLVVGRDFRFGKDAFGNVAMLHDAGAKYDFSITQVNPYQYAGDTISSTRIRAALQHGDFHKASAMLGRNYFMVGPVVVGNRLGSDFGIPTANIRLQRYRAPLEGIFAVRILGLSKEYFGAAYVGTRPTLGGTEPLLEVHIFDLDQDIYGVRLKICFLKKIRSDQKFASVAQLQAQMEQDISKIQHWFKTQRLERYY